MSRGCPGPPLRGCTVAAVKQYYEDLWERLPDDLTPPDFELRRAFLRGALKRGDRVLDLGAGAGEFTAIAAAAGTEVIGAEVAEAALARAGHLCCGGCCWPGPSGSWRPPPRASARSGR